MIKIIYLNSIQKFIDIKKVVNVFTQIPLFLILYLFYTGGRDRTDTPKRNGILSPARLPIPPRRLNIKKKLPLGSNIGAEDRTYTYTSFREGMCSKN